MIAGTVFGTVPAGIGGGMKRYVYMRVSNDEYELPEAVSDSVTELARMCGTTPASVSSSISHGRKTYVRVEMEENEDDQD